MRPKSIVMFERLFLASLAISALSFAFGYEALVERVANEPGVAELGLAGALVAGTFAAGMGIYLLLWLFIARRASNVGKWILVAILILNLLSLAFSLTMGTRLDTQSAVGFAVYALEVAAAYFLFRPDAVAWLRGKGWADPATFE